MRKPVLVIGGGIAGIQASLDLAEMGTPVFIVEKTPSIGGRMAQLDKTFPTNDCSACILAPKVTSCYNHPLIKTFTWSEVIGIKGEAPDFKVTIRKKARFIDEDKCTGCEECVLACPIEAKSEFDMGVGIRHAIYKPFAQAVPNKVVIDKKGTSPCKFNCPAHIDAHGYIALIGQKRYKEALELVRKVTPFAGVLGRVCFHPCEDACSRQYLDSPISIAALKRFIADYEVAQGIKPQVEFKEEENKIKGYKTEGDQIENNNKTKVAIIGSGPAGLNCAYRLALLGYKVTVFEALEEPGGMLRVGIPDYRLDKEVLDREIQIIKEMGVDILCNRAIGKDLTLDDLRKEGYKAFFLAIGAHKDIRLGIPEEDSKGVISGIEFLRNLNLSTTQKVSIGRRVLIIGGGNVAMDAARSARRLGADVKVIYRRTEREMPANIWEIKHAKEEGIEFKYLTTPLEIIADMGRVASLKCIENKLGNPDSSGRRRPEPVPGSEFIIECDTIITAIGQRIDKEPIEKALGKCFDDKGQIIWDRQSMKTNIEDLFTGGDAATGPATAIEAIDAGNRAARSIHNYLSGAELPIDPFILPQTPIEDIDLSKLTPSPRENTPVIGLEKRLTTFEEVELGFSEEEAVREALRCGDCSICSECKACVTACQANAICHQQRDQIIEIPVSAVIVANGFDPGYDIPPELGYGRYKDVVTSMEYERILSASGPFKGHVQRISDGKPPERIAFIQCVGSRDIRCNEDYCSSVCCMYAVKEAMITREHLPSVKDIHIFYMDIRAYGKDFDKYIDSAKENYNIKFIRSRISDVTKKDENGKLVINYCNDEGYISSDEYDIIVLSVGLKANKELRPVLESAEVKTDKYGFVWINEMAPPETTKKGILACGASSGPKDIPETVVEASAAAASAAIISKNYSIKDEVMVPATPGGVFQSDIPFAKVYTQYFKEEVKVKERDVSKEPVRIGVFVCHCGVNIGGYVDVKSVVEYAKTLPFVEHAEDNLYTCSVDAQKVIIDRIKEYNLNRVVVASCTPRTHEPLFQDVLKRTGLNPYLFSMANIRDQCSWVHMGKYEDATRKSKDLVRMAVGRVTYAKQLTRQKIEVNKSALVIGGGMAGMSAALEIANMGHKVYLIEKTGSLGGNAVNLNMMPSGRLVENYLRDYIDEVLNNELISVFLNTEVEDIDGYMGKYKTVLSTGGEEKEINHGTVIIATGAKEYRPKEYLYGTGEKIVTQMELERIIKEGLNKKNEYLKNIKEVVMIQCVGSREKDREYCSRVCCTQALKNALILKEGKGNINITILYRDIRAYGMNELVYKKARMEGVQFIRYETDKIPETLYNEEGEIEVRVYDPILKNKVKINPDLLVLSSAIIPNIEENTKIAQFLKVPLNQEGFFLEAHAKLRPVDFATDGVFLCGLAHSPKNLKECITQGKAAAARALTIISKDFLESEGTIAQVSEEFCVGCGACEEVCAYKAVSVQEIKTRTGMVKKAVVNGALCKGCGTCAAICRCGAIDVNGFSDRQVMKEIEYLLRRA